MSSLGEKLFRLKLTRNTTTRWSRVDCIRRLLVFSLICLLISRYVVACFGAGCACGEDDLVRAVLPFKYITVKWNDELAASHLIIHAWEQRIFLLLLPSPGSDSERRCSHRSSGRLVAAFWLVCASARIYLNVHSLMMTVARADASE